MTDGASCLLVGACPVRLQRAADVAHEHVRLEDICALRRGESRRFLRNPALAQAGQLDVATQKVAEESGSAAAEPRIFQCARLHEANVGKGRIGIEGRRNGRDTTC